MPLPELAIQDLGYIAVPQARAYEAFAFDGDIFVGCQTTAWEGDWAEYGGCWNELTGSWVGPPPLRATPQNLRIEGQSLDTTGTYPVAEIDEDEDFSVLCELPGTEIQGIHEIGYLPATIRFQLYNADTGALVEEVDAVCQATGSGTPTTVATFEGVPAGSYQLCAHIHQATRQPINAAQYLEIIGVTLSPEYNYTEDDSTYFWDYRRNIGRLPSDTEHEFYNLRRLLVDNGEQLDKPEWTAFLVSSSSEGGEWSFLRIQAGAGSWVAGEAFPNPGPALLKKSGALTETTQWQVADGVPFDTMARCVSASKVVRWGNTLTTAEGDLLIAGNLSLESGTCSALWKLNDDGTSQLLGYNTDLSNGMCQCAKRNHAINGIGELRNGTIYCLSECALYVYDPHGDTLGESLPGFPLGTDGEPGGYSLRIHNERPTFFTENFFGPSFRNDPVFYNRFQELINGRRNEAGPGTVWHGRECSTALWNQLWGISQTSATEEVGAQQWLSRMVEGRWIRDHADSWPAHDYNWKQVANVRGRLLMAGTLPVWEEVEDEDTGEVGEVLNRDAISPLWAVDDGTRLREMDAPWIPQYLTKCDDADGDEILVGVARKVEDGEIESVQRIVTLTGLSVAEEEEEDEDETDPDIPGNAQEGIDLMPDGSRWQVIVPQLNGVTWTAVQVCDLGALDADRMRPLEKEFLTYPFILWYRVDSDEDQDDLTTYRYRASFRTFISLKREALEKLEFVVLWSDELDDVVMPSIERRG